MDGSHFDRLTKSLSASGTRRHIVRVLAAMPLGVTLTTLLGDGPDATAKKKKKQQHDDDAGSSHRQHRRVVRNRRDSGQDKDSRKGKRKGCTPKPRSKTCAGKCGTVRNNCGKPVDCGLCTCATGCPQCLSCIPATGRCEPVANGVSCDDGDACTQADTCQNGVCAGTPISCPSGERCVGGSCVCDGCRNGTTCLAGTDTAACGSGGGICLQCTGSNQTCCGQACKGGGNASCTGPDNCCSGTCVPIVVSSSLENRCCPACPANCQCRLGSGSTLVCVEAPSSTPCTGPEFCGPDEACVSTMGGIGGDPRCAKLCTPLA